MGGPQGAHPRRARPRMRGPGADSESEALFWTHAEPLLRRHEVSRSTREEPAVDPHTRHPHSLPTDAPRSALRVQQAQRQRSDPATAKPHAIGETSHSCQGVAPGSRSARRGSGMASRAEVLISGRAAWVDGALELFVLPAYSPRAAQSALGGRRDPVRSGNAAAYLTHVSNHRQVPIRWARRRGSLRAAGWGMVQFMAPARGGLWRAAPRS
jgi:hypothetical protein